MSKVKFILILLISIILVGSFFLSIKNYNEIWKALKKSNIYNVILCLLIGMTGYFIRAWRWKYLLLPVKRINLWSLTKAIIIGFMVSIVLPGRLGELVRPYLIGVWEKISKSSALATVILERIIDLLCVLAYFSLYVYFFSIPETKSFWFTLAKKSSMIALLTATSGITILILWGFKPNIVNKIIQYALFFTGSRFRNKALGLANSFSDGLLVLKDPILIIKVICISLLFWLSVAVGTAFMIWAFLPNIPFTASFFVLGLLVIGVAIPTPAGVGGFHWGVRLSLRWLGVEDNIAAAIAILLHFISFLPLLISGIFLLWYEGINWSRLSKLESKTINTLES